MIAHDLLAQRLEQTTKALRTLGALTWQRTSDWTVAGRMPTRGQRGGGMRDDAVDDDRADDSAQDRAAARYHDELDALTKRMDADAHRLQTITRICCPAAPKHLGSRDMLVAQVAADGWCVSCWRDGQHLTPITLRPATAGQRPSPFYSDACRACGEWKAEHGAFPPLEILRLRHDGRRVTTQVADRVLGRTG